MPCHLPWLLDKYRALRPKEYQTNGPGQSQEEREDRHIFLTGTAVLSTTALDQACDARSRSVPVDLVYVIFIDFLALGVLRFCFLLLSNVQFLVLVNLPPGLATRG